MNIIAVSTTKPSNRPDMARNRLETRRAGILCRSFSTPSMEEVTLRGAELASVPAQRSVEDAATVGARAFTTVLGATSGKPNLSFVPGGSVNFVSTIRRTVFLGFVSDVGVRTNGAGANYWSHVNIIPYLSAYAIYCVTARARILHWEP